MRKTTPIIVLAAGFLSAAALSGQNLNPTIEVTNTYQRRAAEIAKPQQKMNIPDSLLRFDLDFDYEVFDRPYEGAYSFKPYMLDMRPGKDAWRGRKLYVKAGAGYSLRPDVDIVWSPELNGRFQMSVHAANKSFFGTYNSISPVRSAEDGPAELRPDGGTYKGFDSYTSAGIDGRCSWDKAVMSFEVGYKRLDVRDTVLTQAWQSADFGLRVVSNVHEGRRFHYDVALSGSLGYGSLDYSLPFAVVESGGAGGGQPKVVIPAGMNYLDETGFALKGDVGPVFNDHHKVLVGFESKNYKYSGLLSSNASLLTLRPRYVFEKNRWELSLGAKIEDRLAAQTDSLTKLPFPRSHKSDGWSIHPDARVSFRVADAVRIHAGLTGGSEVNAYSSLLGRNHHFNPASSVGLRSPLMDFSREVVRVALGVGGQVASRLQFELSGGAAICEMVPFDCIYDCTPYTIYPWPSEQVTAGGRQAGVCYSDIALYFADLLLSWKSKSLTVDADLRYRSSHFPDVGLAAGAVRANPLKLPAFTADLRALYNINPRIRAGIDLQAATARQENGDPMGFRIPGYVDLGLVGGWQVSRKFGVWAESGNLLFMNIQRTPLHCERGAWGTIGVTLSL